MAKGSQFERDVCRTLSLWWSNGTADDLFWRTSTSGGRAKSRSRRGRDTTNSHGDIMALDPAGQPLVDLICFELKRGYNRATLHDLIDRPDGGAKQQWEKWIDQAEESCAAGGCYTWAVVARRDNRGSVILIPESFFRRLVVILCTADRLTVRTDSARVVAITLDDFLRLVPPKFIKDLAKRV